MSEEKEVITYSIQDYLELEYAAESRSEYRNGKIVAMSGGTLNHSNISARMLALLISGIGTKNCIPYTSDARIFIEKANSFVYPDAMVICGPVEISEKDKNAVINPILVVEVLSKSTESYDRGEKFHKYCSLPSFKEYILIDQNQPVIDVLYKEEPGYWKMSTAIGLEKSIYLSTLDYTIPLKEIYKNVSDLSAPQFRIDV